MPIYEFACQDCGHEFEKIQTFSDSSTPVCPNCQGVHVQRRLSAPAIHFKGSGWYITDSKKAAKGSATGGSASSDETKGDGAGKGESSKSETGKGETGKSESSKSETGKSEGSGESKAGGGKSESSPAPAAAKAD